VQLDFSTLFVHPVLLFLGLALGAIGVWYAMPRANRAPRELGGIVAAIGVALVFLGVILRGAEAFPESFPNVFFYAFALIGLASALRVITHPKPVYAALFFILTILSSAGLYVLLSAEFLAFALVIIYAGAILITYLFVIMLATQAPSEDAPSEGDVADRVSRAPNGAVLAGFLLLAALTGLFNAGVSSLPPSGSLPSVVHADEPLERLPGKVKDALVERGAPEEIIVASAPERGLLINARPNARTVLAQIEYEAGIPFIKAYHAAVAAQMPEARRAAYLSSQQLVRNGQSEPMFAANEVVEPLAPSTLALLEFEDRPTLILPNLRRPSQLAEGEPWAPSWTIQFRMPDELAAVNLERVGFALLAEHPLALELAGVILLMALVGAVVVARKQIEAGEAETEAAAAAAGQSGRGVAE
jgi:NADH:ubiquinone oxidoreductase subunit 6 (subunit J)